MKKIIVMSDNHGDQQVISFIKNQHQDADAYIHLGDSETNHVEDLDGLICVSGNNDWMIDLPNATILEVESLRFYLTHGQHFGYFNKEEKMYKKLIENGCDVLLSGHTHMPNFEQYEDKYFINPGSTSWPRGGSQPSYAVIIVDKDQINCEHIIL